MIDRIQINLNNDIVNFRAQQSILSLIQTNRFENTKKAYDSHHKEWREWCFFKQYDDDDIIHEIKLIKFLTKKIIVRSLRDRQKKKNKKRKKNQDKEESDLNDELIDDNIVLIAAIAEKVIDENVDSADSSQTLSFQVIRDYKTALITLWIYQRSRRLNRHDHFNEVFLQNFMKIQRIIQHKKAKKRHEDRARDTIADEYNFEKLRQITDSFWRHFKAIKFISIGVYLRTLLNFLLSHFLLLRDESRRHAELSNLQLLHLENESNNTHKSASCLLYVMSNDKINQNDRIEYAELLRHRELNLCTLSVLTSYLMWRWHQFDEKFSTFKNNKNWYDV